MSIVRNTLNSQNTPFFRAFRQMDLPEDTIPVRSISDMIALNFVVPSARIMVNTTYGAANPFEFVLEMVNLTTDTPLSVEVVTDGFFRLSTTSLRLRPSQRSEVTVSTNSAYINDQVAQPFRASDLRVIVQNETTDLAFINLRTPRPDTENFPSEINVT